MSCPETKTRSSRGAIATVSACVVTSDTGTPVSDFTKLTDGTKFSAVPKWAAGSAHAPEFVLSGEVPKKKARLASKAPSLAPDASAVERAAFKTCGGTRDVFATRSKASLDAHLSKLEPAELRALVAWSTPADLAVLESHPRVRDLAGDVLAERKSVHTPDALAADRETFEACMHLRLRSKELTLGTARRFDEDASVLMGAIMELRVNGNNPELLADNVARRTATLAGRLDEVEQRISELMRGTSTTPGVEWLGKNRQQVLEHDSAARAEALAELRNVVDGRITPVMTAVRQKREAVEKLTLLAEQLRRTPRTSQPSSPYRSQEEIVNSMAMIHREMNMSSDHLENIAAQLEETLNEQFLPAFPA